MVSETLIRLSSPVARSCLLTISFGLIVDAALLIYASIQYPYLIDQYHDYLYINSSQSLPVIYSTVSIVAIIVAASTATVSYYKETTNYVLVHAGICGVFLPVIIMVYFSTGTLRYKPSDYYKDFDKMIRDYQVSNSPEVEVNNLEQAKVETNSSSNHNQNSEFSRTFLTSFINQIDSLQSKLSCCGVDSAQDWVKAWDGYISPSCCSEQDKRINEQWAKNFKVDEKHNFEHCSLEKAYHLGCVVTLKEEEYFKYNWLSDLVIFMTVMTIANTFFSMLLFGFKKTEDSPYETNEHELSIVGVSTRPRPSQPTITSIKARPSVVHTIGLSQENIAARAQAVRFNLSQSPRTSVSSQSKFSAAARRASSFI